MLIEWWKIIILGIVEGVTEFLPISSTGHLIVAADLLNFGQALGGTFEIFIQIGAVFAVIGFYRVDIWRQMRGVARDTSIQHFWLAILIAFIPAAAIGVLLSDWIKAVLFNPVVVALALIVGGVIFLLVERRPQPAASTVTEVTAITLRQALLIGLAQVSALIPGVSRSGATIVGGLLTGLNRRAATEFSFYLAIPTLGAATLYDLVRSLDTLSSEDLGALLLGAAVSFVVAWMAIAWLLRFVQRNTFVSFGIYRIAAGVLILVLAAAGLFA